ncbi:MAG: glycosyltransferase, partial [Inhella sp.]
VLLAVGRLAAEKNLGTLLQAFQALRQQQPLAKLVLVGDGPQRAALQASCPEAIFAGLRRGEDLATHYASADLFAFPSLTETFGNVVPEALASGLPVVAFDYAAAAQLLRSQTAGALAAFGDNQAFIDAVTALGSNHGELRSKGAQAQGIAKLLGWDAILNSMESHYRAALSTQRVEATSAALATS